MKGNKKHSLPKKSKKKVSNNVSKFQELKFWLFNSKNGKHIIDPALLSDFLEKNNFYNVSYFGTRLIVKVDNNIAKILKPQGVYNFVIEYVKQQKKNDLRSQFIKDGEALLISKKAILGSLQELTLKRFKDTKHSGIFFFKNVFIVINKAGFKSYEYSKLSEVINGYFIFESQIIDNTFQPQNDYKKSQFYEFLKLSTNEKTHLKNVVTSLGYILHRYKNPSVAKAIILSDILSQATNTASGRSGKGLMIKALAEVLNVVEYNGKNLDLSKDKFVFQSITPQTDLFVLQDVEQSFSFEALFAVLTDKMNIEKKHQDKITLDFESSPKIAVTTNYTLSDKGGSYTDRKHVVLLNNHFNSTNKPENHFKNLFFIEWDDKEYQRFYSFMIFCLKKYFKSGLINYDSPELRLQKLEVDTSKDFLKLMKSTYGKLNEYYLLKDIAKDLGDSINSNNGSVRSRVASGWINIWADFKGYNVERLESGGIVKFGFTKKKS